ncbi:MULTISPECIES: lipopolysaccharide assembly protein LapB [Variovorax]|jgi:lipopolysaccharide biosynthesis regulator YciM|uniref:lipopolysaccharide assembly protein LapB n=1 Tax=Variovorax TaxID=34072 RepID=UPI00089D441E|nr:MULTISPECIES: lipopolysaccharide assembly protein LapB [Variovorax]UVH55641.1 lipopolysaccharide assembly protein LapB [Variovorax paradoxus]SDW49061.1 Lipopolysaccharide biosynthesis regulator YciM, contains six TPR domains and a predicted metal-binding C-terminal domain [Variovorax sp. YR634]SDY03090.1 Lipopolysaccharide biosynthesis regulator YciM, contains six TPR domains and a predicted metal-binding C-terminal domain [Variovorax sp. YR266]SET13147.1 Lipopolysaccharide biosynthesis regu
MDFDPSWLLISLPVAFVLGWLASRFDIRQLKLENRQAPKAYFRGLNFLLNEQQDQAIDAFIEAVQNDPDTQELHFALGNLFRRRGEYQRAVRVHEHLLGRGDLSRSDRERAQHALAQDFLRAGLLDRAEAALQKLEGTRYENEARLSLLAIYERSREWAQAADVAQKLDESDQASYSTRRAHHLCEQATERVAAGDLPGAAKLLAQAVELAPQAPRPAIDTANLQLRNGEAAAAFDTLVALSETAPLALPLYAAALQQAAVAAHREGEALALLQRRYVESPSIDVLEALMALGGTPTATAEEPNPTPRDGYIAHLAQQPSLVAASRWLAGEHFEHQQFHPQVQRALDQATRPLMRYRCAACGFEAHQYFWHCPGCQAWDSYPPRRVEEL